MMGTKMLRVLVCSCALGTLLSAGTTDQAQFYPNQETVKPTSAAQDEPQVTPPADFQIALKAADDNLKKKGGKRYDKSFGRAAAPWLGPSIFRWTSDIPTATGVEPFTVLVRVGATGAAEEVLVWPETKVAQRLRAEFPSTGHPKPPGSSWWVKLDVTIELKDAVPGEKPKKPANPQLGAAEGSGIVYGGDLGILVSAPKGWVLDKRSGVSQGQHAVMYPKGSSWKNAGEVMYVNIGGMGPAESLEAFIAHDIEQFKKKFPRINVEGPDPINIAAGGLAQVRALSGGGYSSYECVAYAPHGSRVVIYVLTCRSKKGYEKTLSLFIEMVAKSVPAKLSFKGSTGGQTR